MMIQKVFGFSESCRQVSKSALVRLIDQIKRCLQLERLNTSASLQRRIVPSSSRQLAYRT